MNRLGQCLRELRDARGWTQEQLSERSNVPQTTISSLESGRVARVGPVRHRRTRIAPSALPACASTTGASAPSHSPNRRTIRHSHRAGYSSTTTMARGCSVMFAGASTAACPGTSSCMASPLTSTRSNSASPAPPRSGRHNAWRANGKRRWRTTSARSGARIWRNCRTPAGRAGWTPACHRGSRRARPNAAPIAAGNTSPRLHRPSRHRHRAPLSAPGVGRPSTCPPASVGRNTVHPAGQWPTAQGSRASPPPPTSPPSPPGC